MKLMPWHKKLAIELVEEFLTTEEAQVLSLDDSGDRLSFAWRFTQFLDKQEQNNEAIGTSTIV